MKYLLAATLACFPMTHVMGADEKPPVVARIYSMADLVVQPQKPESNQQQANKTAITGQSIAISNEKIIARNLKELVEIVRMAVSTEDWIENGGRGAVAIHSNTRSLVIRQTESGHNEIVELLEALRRQQDVSIDVTLELFEDLNQEKAAAVIQQVSATSESPSVPAETETITLGTLAADFGPSIDPQEMKELRKRLKDVQAEKFSERFSIPNGHTGGSQYLTATTCSSADRRYVTINVAFTLEGSLVGIRGTTLPDGHGTVFEFRMPEINHHVACLVTTKLRILEEEEEVFVKPEIQADAK